MCSTTVAATAAQGVGNLQEKIITSDEDGRPIVPKPAAPVLGHPDEDPAVGKPELPAERLELLLLPPRLGHDEGRGWVDRFAPGLGGVLAERLVDDGQTVALIEPLESRRTNLNNKYFH